MANQYKLPLCWVGHPSTNHPETVDFIVGKHTDKTRVITVEDCNPKCHCANSPMQAMFCMEGHMTECHAGMTCEQAQCSHYQRSLGSEDYI
jgi:hypothetical protein